jgi:CRISPR-associated endoribonuclease Cas6
MSGDYFALFPEPLLVWDSLLRTWNRYAPDTFTIEKQTLRTFLRSFVTVSACDDLATHTLHYPKYTQKGFTGICRYQVDGDDTHAGQLTALAEFARYSGVGYKTTMGMGQVRIKE